MSIRWLSKLLEVNKGDEYSVSLLDGKRIDYFLTDELSKNVAFLIDIDESILHHFNRYDYEGRHDGCQQYNTRKRSL